MKIFTFLDSTDQDVQKRAEAELTRLVKNTGIEVYFSLFDGFKNLTWAKATEGEFKGQSFPTVETTDFLLAEAIKRLGYKPDVVLSVINRDSFGGLYWGVHLGYRPQGVQMCFAKSSDRMEDTIGHEIAHTFNDIIGGNILNELFEVTDYDQKVVHRQSNAKHWREIFLKVSPYLVDKKSRMIALIHEALRLIGLYKTLIEQGKQNIITMTKSEQIYEKALSLVGTDASPSDEVNDSIACAETLSTIINSIDNTFPVITGTWTLWDFVKRIRKDFIKITQPEKGAILMYVTGTGNGKIKNGHVFIVGENGKLLSNNSLTGKFDSHWTVETARNHYGVEGGYPRYIYRWI